MEAGCRSVIVFPESGWKAAEELALLEAVEVFGFGNWEDTAGMVGRRSADEVRDHFISYYVKGRVGRVTWSLASRDKYQAEDHTCSRDGHLSPSLTTPLPSIPELSPLEQQHLGYMPKRDDFEREFDNEVEMLISTLRISPNDEDDLDVELKVAHIDMYNRRLRERFRKKAVVRNYGLVSEFYKSLSGDEEIMSLIHPQSPSAAATSLTASSSELCRSSPVDAVASPVAGYNNNSRMQSSPIPSPASNAKSHSSSPLIPSSPSITSGRSSAVNGLATPTKKRSLSPQKSATCDTLSSQAVDRLHEQMKEKFKIYSQFQSALDQKQLLDGLKRERELKLRIKDLIRYRKSGITKLSEVDGLESARNERNEKRKENKKKGVSTLSDRKSMGKESQTVRGGKGSSPSQTGTAGSPSNATACIISSMDSKSRSSPLTSPTSKAGATRPISPTEVAVCKSEQLSERKGIRCESSHGDDSSSANIAQLKEFDVNSMPSARLLNTQEKKVCSTLRLTPSQYINIKGLMLGGKSLPKKQKSGLENLDGRIKRRLQGFFTRSGWIKG